MRAFAILYQVLLALLFGMPWAVEARAAAPSPEDQTILQAIQDKLQAAQGQGLQAALYTYQEALPLCQCLQDHDCKVGLLATVHQRLAASYMAQEAHAKAQASLEQMVAYATQLSDKHPAKMQMLTMAQALRFQVHADLGQALLRQEGKEAEAQPYLEQALQLSDGIDDPQAQALRLQVHADLGGCCFLSHDYARAIHHIDRALVLASALPAHPANQAIIIKLHMRLREVYLAQDRPAEALRCLQEAQEACEKLPKQDEQKAWILAHLVCRQRKAKTCLDTTVLATTAHAKALPHIEEANNHFEKAQQTSRQSEGQIEAYRDDDMLLHKALRGTLAACSIRISTPVGCLVAVGALLMFLAWYYHAPKAPKTKAMETQEENLEEEEEDNIEEASLLKEACPSHGEEG